MKLGGTNKVTLFQCSANEFLCLNNNMCIDKSKFCNKKDDCGDNSDEPLDCENNCAAAIKAFSPVFLLTHILNCLPDYNSHSLFLHKVSFSSNIQIKPIQIYYILHFVIHLLDLLNYLNLISFQNQICDGKIDCRGENDIGQDESASKCCTVS